MKTDAELLEIYMRGFNNELDGIPDEEHSDELSKRAYDLGTIDAYCGDDVSSIDLQTNDEILNKIKSDDRWL